MSGSPPPEEQKKADAEARAKEQAEQAALPYKWDQTIKDLDITITIDGKYKGKDLIIDIGRNKLKAGIKGQEPFIDVCCFLRCLAMSCANAFSRASCLMPSVSTTPPGH
jgi:hypothetical protein